MFVNKLQSIRTYGFIDEAVTIPAGTSTEYLVGSITFPVDSVLGYAVCPWAYFQMGWSLVRSASDTTSFSIIMRVNNQLASTYAGVTSPRYFAAASISNAMVSNGVLVGGYSGSSATPPAVFDPVILNTQEIVFSVSVLPVSALTADIAVKNMFLQYFFLGNGGGP